MTQTVKDQFHAQITGALKDAKYPIKTPEDLMSAFPKGKDTTCHAGIVNMTAGEAGKLLTASDFPLKSSDSIADMILSRAGM